MADQEGQRYLLFKLLLGVGGLLGLLLLFQTVSNYRYVSERIVTESLYRESARHTSYILQQGREAEAREPADWERVLDRIRKERAKDIAWLSIYNLKGEPVASSGPAGEKFSPAEIRDLLQPGGRVFRMEETPRGEVFVALQPFRYAFHAPRQSGGREGSQAKSGPAAGQRRGGPRVIEIALYANSVDPVFGALRRNMILNISAAIALLASMGFIGLRFKNYLRGKQLEKQLEVARTVQQDFLPKEPSAHLNLDVAALCDPAYQVGGDFYDIFQASENRVTMILGDVSGKGLPAALLMGMIYGAVRAGASAPEAVTLEEATQRLNQLLCTRTSVERFVTMFWCNYCPVEQSLQYVNAGHLPPYVVRKSDGAAPKIERLEEGGPVLGVIPEARYAHAEIPFRPDDLLVLYSDGVVEAANERGQEFGDARLEAILGNSQGLSATEVRDEILRQVHQFVGEEPAQDDLTLLVVRGGAVVSPSQDAARAELQAV